MSTMPAASEVPTTTPGASAASTSADNTPMIFTSVAGSGAPVTKSSSVPGKRVLPPAGPSTQVASGS